MTISLPFSLPMQSDAPPDSLSGQQLRSGSRSSSSKQSQETNNSSSNSSQQSKDDVGEASFAGALAAALLTNGIVSNQPVVPTSGTATGSIVSEEMVSPVLPSGTSTGQASIGTTTDLLSATPVIAGQSSAALSVGEGVRSDVLSGVIPGTSAAATSIGNSAETEMSPLRIMLLQRLQLPGSATGQLNANAQQMTQVSVISVENTGDAASMSDMLADMQEMLSSAMPPDFISDSAIVMTDPDDESMQIAEELLSVGSNGAAITNAGTMSAVFDSSSGGRLSGLQSMLKRLSDRMAAAVESGGAVRGNEFKLNGVSQSYSEGLNRVSGIMPGGMVPSTTDEITLESVSPVMPDSDSLDQLTSGTGSNGSTNSESITSSSAIVAGSSASATGTSLLTDTIRQPLSTQVSQAIYQHLYLNRERDNSSMTVRLDPPELGELVIRLSRTDDGLAVRVSAREPVTMDMLLARGEEIESNLADLQLDLANIEFLPPEMDNGGFSQWFGRNQDERPEASSPVRQTLRQTTPNAVSDTPVIAETRTTGQLSFVA
ncbi:MAG: flagellar hook-length control protein FliK [Planctomyces sp.]|nr:flagellar hook-length control protein FliK [Planctomyces sp.]